MIKSKDVMNERPNFTHGDIFLQGNNCNHYLLVCALDGADNASEFGLVNLNTGWTYDGHFHSCVDTHNITITEFCKATHGHKFGFVGLLSGVRRKDETNNI